MTIRGKLREAAREQIEDMVEKLEGAALQISQDYPIEPHELCRLVATRKSKTLMGKLQGRMADEAEKKIISELTPPDENF